MAAILFRGMSQQEREALQEVSNPEWHVVMSCYGNRPNHSGSQKPDTHIFMPQNNIYVI